MKRLVLAALLAVPLSSTEAQLFSNESLNGAAWGGLIGGIIGHNRGRQTAEGIGIGAGVGLLLGALASNRPQENYFYPGTVPVEPTPGYYSYAPVRPSFALTGAALGGVAGGIIGHNSGRKTAEGVALGAGAGLVLGALAESQARPRIHYAPAAPLYVAPGTAVIQAAPVATRPPRTQAPLVKSVIERPTSMSSANSLFGR